MISQLGETFGDCQPWNTIHPEKHTNLLNNLTSNLHCYEQLAKKRSGSQRLPELRRRDPASTAQLKSKPQLVRTINNKTIQNTQKSTRERTHSVWNNSVQLHCSKSEIRVDRTGNSHKRGGTALQTLQPRNKEAATERREEGRKVCLLSFEELSRCGRIRKRELHRMIFGGKKEREAVIQKMR